MKSTALPIAVAPHQSVGKRKVLRSFCILLLVLALVTGALWVRRAVRLSGAADPRLVGKWTSDYFPTEWGTARMILDIDRDNIVIVFTFDAVRGEAMSGTDKYSVSEGTFQSPSFESGKPIRYRIDGSSLTLLDAVDGPSLFHRAWWSDIWP